jgi:uncharacterized damage-inducible protein DinB
MTDPFDVPAAADDRAMLIGFLERQRALLLWKVRDLGPEDLRRTVGVSTVTLGGLLKHLAVVEAFWFRNVWSDEPKGEPWDSVDWEADRDWDWRTAADDSPEQLRRLWEHEVTHARALVDAAPDLDAPAAHQFDQAEYRPTLRWILHHLVEEYSRHVGHADLIREAIDGQVGEDPPADQRQ